MNIISDVYKASATWRRLVILLCVSSCGVMQSGCGPPTVHRVEVSGQATFEGRPLQHGQIVIESIDGTGPTDLAAITDGSFRIRTSPGEKRVRITATEETSEDTFNAMGLVEKKQVELIPERYNTQTTLTCKVGDDARQNQLEFHLE